MKGFDFSGDIWTTSNYFMNLYTVLEYARDYMQETKAQQSIEVMVEWLLRKQNPSTGMWHECAVEDADTSEKLKIVRGAYHFWSNKSTAREQAYYFLKQVHLENGDLPPVLDIEHMPKNRSIEDFQRDVLTWLHIVEDRYHVKPIIYTYFKFKEKYLNAPVFEDYPYWIAHYYVDKVEYKGSWKFWYVNEKLAGSMGVGPTS